MTVSFRVDVGVEDIVTVAVAVGVVPSALPNQRVSRTQISVISRILLRERSLDILFRTLPTGSL